MKRKNNQKDLTKVLKELDAALKKAGFNLKMYAVTKEGVKKIDSKEELK